MVSLLQVSFRGVEVKSKGTWVTKSPTTQGPQVQDLPNLTLSFKKTTNQISTKVSKHKVLVPNNDTYIIVWFPLVSPPPNQIVRCSQWTNI